MDQLLPVEGRKCFRVAGPGLLDALDVLGKNASRIQGGAARIATHALLLSSGKRFFLVHILSDDPNQTLAAMRPCSKIFAAVTRGGARHAYDPMLFDGATLYHDGMVCLRDGFTSYSCDIRPATLAIEWGAEADRIVSLAVAFAKAEQQCFFEVDWHSYPKSGKVEYRPAARTSGGRVTPAYIDYFAVSKLKFEKYKFEAFLEFVNQHTPDPKDRLSRQAIADILRDAGVRLPRSGCDARN